MRYTDQEIKTKVDISIALLFKYDSFLLENYVHERSVAHKIAEYLQDQFPEWHVDCEYNKKGFNNKVLVGIRECNEQRRTDRVYPDIIVHQRNSDNNLLIVEMKTTTNDKSCDIKKLELFTQDRSFHYQLGLFVEFNSLKEPKLMYFKEGKICQ